MGAPAQARRDFLTDIFASRRFAVPELIDAEAFDAKFKGGSGHPKPPRRAVHSRDASSRLLKRSLDRLAFL